jgi:Flp pilus assembly protein TadG
MTRFTPPALRRFARDDKGSVITETVIIFPILIWAYIALFVYWDAYRTENTAVKASYTIADQITREVMDITPAYITGLQTTFQYLVDNTLDSTIVVSSIAWDEATQRYDVLYSEARGTGAVRMTDAMLQTHLDELPNMSDGDTVIVVQTTTRYVPLYQVGVPTFTYGQFIVTRPRGGKVTCPTCALS